MNCNHIQTLISAYLDGEMSGREMQMVRSHLHRCPSCSAELEFARQMKETVSQGPFAEPPSGFEDRLFAHVLKEEPKNHRFLPITMIGFVALIAFSVTFASVRVQRSNDATARIDVSRDEAYIEASDPSNNGLVLNTSYGP